MATSERSILAEMALQFVEQREVLATSALGHLLRRSPEARQAVRDLMPDRGVALPPDLVYQNEQIEPGAEGRPDVVGMAGMHCLP
jgi:hypothetical protein